MPVGVPKPNRKLAESLREKLLRQIGQPVTYERLTPIRGHWPSSHVIPTPRANWSYQPRGQAGKPKPISAPLSADEILASLNV